MLYADWLSPFSWRSRVALLISGYFLVQVLFVWLASNAYLLRVDDAYYYFGIAQRYIETGKFTFDGIHLTNGFQPLWQFCLIGITWMAGRLGVESRETFVICYFLFCAALNTTSFVALVYLARKCFRNRARSAKVFLYAALWFPGLTISLLSGMENSLNWFLLIVLIERLLNEDGQPVLPEIKSRRMLQLIVVSALFSYTRVDNVIILSSVAAYFLATGKSVKTIRRVILWGAAVFASWIPLLVWQSKEFGSATPVSGSVKLWLSTELIRTVGFQGYLLHAAKAFLLSLAGLPLSAVGMGYYEILKPSIMSAGFERTIAVTGISCVLIVPLGILLLGIRTRAWKIRTAPAVIPLLLTVCVVHLGVTSSLLPDQWRYAGFVWYFLVEYLLFFIVTAWLLGPILESLSSHTVRSVQGAFLILYVLAIPPLIMWRPAVPTEQQLKYIGAYWMNEHLPRNSLVAARNAGVTGYFADIPVVNLDGLVNDTDFLKHYLKEDRVGDYLRDTNVTHIADHDCPRRIPGWYRKWAYISSRRDILFCMQGNEKGLDFCVIKLPGHDQSD